jgi:putative ABC transport system permease protein
MISVVLAITVTIIGKQISYINSKNLGLDKDIHSINISGVNPSTALTLKQELIKLPSVKSAAVASSVPFFGYWTTLGYYGPSDAEKKYELALIVGDLDLPTVLGISVEQGSAFTQEHRNQPVCLVNQTLAKQFGWENAIGETLPGNSERIVGVVRNFHCNSLIEPIIPAAILINPNGDRLLVKFANSLTDTEYQQVLAIWQRLTGKKDLEILSLSSKLQEINGEHSRMLSLLQILCGLAFFITGIGIFANTKSQMQNRLKEIAIRKINGASIANIFGMLYKDFALRSIAAFAIAIPIANYLATRWLSQFAYQTNLSWWFYTIGIVLSAVVIVFTITAGALNAGKANPVEVLKTE